jgi:hypothetical protein
MVDFAAIKPLWIKAWFDPGSKLSQLRFAWMGYRFTNHGVTRHWCSLISSLKAMLGAD